MPENGKFENVVITFDEGFAVFHKIGLKNAE